MVNQPMDAVREPARTAVTRFRALRSWRGAVGLSGLAAGAIMITGAFLPWVTTFAGLIGIPGVRGSNGRILAAAGAVIALAGLWHALRGGRWSRWVIGLGGFLATGFSGFLLLQLAASLRSLSTDSMVAGRAGPGLWVTAAGSALAFATMFLPASAQQTLVRRDSPVSLRAWAADFGSTGLRRGLQIVLGVVWLADGALQLQPFMFGRGFVNQILMPAYMGSPAGVTGPALAFTRLVLHAPAAWNAAFAITQLLLGAGLLWRPAVRAALAGSIVWALAVWWFGEGLGGVLSGSASPLTGAPGAVILYALLAVLAWPMARTVRASTLPASTPQTSTEGTDGREAGPVAAGSPLGLTGARVAWLVLWGSSAYFILQAANRAPGAVRDTFAGLAAGEPGWIAAMDRGLASAAGGHGLAISIGLAVVFVAAGLGVFWSATTRAALLLSVIVALAIWVLGENFGEIATGRGTDPNTGLLLVALAAAFWPLARRPAAAVSAGHDQEPVLAEDKAA
ncbi:MAG: hypothetical protein ACRDND_17095 [Streptosporangiaceae bacterium]